MSKAKKFEVIRIGALLTTLLLIILVPITTKILIDENLHFSDFIEGILFLSPFIIAYVVIMIYLLISYLKRGGQ